MKAGYSESLATEEASTEISAVPRRSDEHHIVSLARIPQQTDRGSHGKQPARSSRKKVVQFMLFTASADS